MERLGRTKLAGIASVAALFTVTAAANGVTLSTPVGIGAVGPNRLSAFLVTNVGSTPSKINLVQCVEFGTVDTPSFNDCPVPPATLAPGDTCEVDASSAGHNVFCTVKGTGQLRAALSILDGNNGNALVDTIPATK